MNKARDKWKSQSGASILVALLFLLVCMMVSASILMAAASNAGKTRSVREEQQKYLALSSALRLVCDQLLEAEYYGRYEYTKEAVFVSITNADGSPGEVFDHNIHTYRQEDGRYDCTLSEVLPLRDDFDSIFAEEFKNRNVPGGLGKDEYIYYPLPAAVTLSKHELTLTADVDGDKYPGLTEQVTITVEVDENYTIRLTAALGEPPAGADHYQYLMEAELTPGGAKPVISGSAREGTNPAGPMTWKLGWIAKKEVTDVGP